MTSYEEILDRIEQLDDETWDTYRHDLDDLIEDRYQIADSAVEEFSEPHNDIDMIDGTEPEQIHALKTRILYRGMQKGIHESSTGEAFAEYVRGWHSDVQDAANYSDPEQDVEELVETVFGPLLNKYR